MQSLPRAFKAISQNNLTYELVPFPLKELIFIEQIPCDVFSKARGSYAKVLDRGTAINNQSLRDLITAGVVHTYVREREKSLVVAAQQENLRSNTRSLSIGDPFEKGRRQIHLLTINLKFLYEDPTDDTQLALQYQGTRSLAHFLINNIKIHAQLYFDFSKQKHHYIFAQPMLSSIFLVGVLKQAKIFSDKEVESLFITSYFKDIGMSAIPQEKFDEIELNVLDKKLLYSHAKNSVTILNGRIPLGPSYLKLIENHHAFSIISNELDMYEEGHDEQLLTGFETIVISLVDIIAAMISARPYRKATTLFNALNLVKDLISDHYPQEFKLLVAYFKNFFTKGQE